MRHGYVVCRVDRATGRKDPIGCVLERRRGNRRRSADLVALLEEARRIFGRETERDACLIVEPVGGPGEDREWVMGRGITTIVSRSVRALEADREGWPEFGMEEER